MNAFMKSCPMSIIFFLVIIGARSSAQIQMARQILGNGAVQSANANHRITGSIGQPMIGVQKNSMNNAFIGFWYNKENLAVSVERIANASPSAFHLEQNHPNPFTTSTEIRFVLPSRASVRMEIFNLLGERIALLLDQEMMDGEYRLQWKAGTESSGMFLYRLSAVAAGQVEIVSITKRMIRL